MRPTRTRTTLHCCRTNSGTGASSAWLAAVAGLKIFWISRLWRNPEEAVHILEYGILALLVVNALRHRVHDVTLYARAALIVAGVGIIDELIQWMTPGRYFDLRDIWLNAGAGGLAIVGVWKGIMPPRPEPVTGRSLQRLCRLAMIVTVLLALCFLSTPARVEALARAVPPLHFLADPFDAVAEYGHRHHLPTVGRFTSRFSLEELARLNREGAPEAAARIRKGRSDHGRFFRDTSRAEHPYARETGARIFTRNGRLGRARKAPDHSAEREFNATQALHENLILESCYGRTLELSSSRFGREARSDMEAWANHDDRFESLLDRHLITFASQEQLLWLIGLVLVSLVLTDRIAGRKASASVGDAR